MLLSKHEGSWFFLAEILVNVELQGAEPPREHCGKCRRCLADCPTGALEDGYILNAPICISYLTIEYRGFIPRALRPQMGNWIFGCDICQEVCPWGQKFGRFRKDLLEELFPYLPAFMTMSEEEFCSRFRHSAIRRTKRRGLLRNVAIALGNSGNPAAIPSLLRALEDPEPLVRGHTAWALGLLGGPRVKRSLEGALRHECNPQVQEEMRLALTGEY
jgi:epoxyqueuosine reductase